ncbi:MAG: hypothetical protein WC356_01505 [Candidatus Micrarchaeia archaeon]|jgi:hypothetical protein
MQDKKLFKIGIDAQVLYDRIIQVNPGEIITYEELNELIGRDVQTDAYASLFTARNKARSINRKAFGVMPNVGLKCLEDDEIVGAGHKALDRARGRARNGFKTLICLNNYAGLPDHLKIKHNTVATLLAMVNRITKPKTVAAIEGVISEKMEKLTFSQTLEFFEKK